MNVSRLLLLAVVVPALLGMAKKPAITVRFHLEAEGQTGAPFAVPVKFTNPPREGFMSTVPAISERNIVGIYPTPANGSFGCAFYLDSHGRLALETLSREHRGSSLIAFVATKGGTHQVLDMIIDRPVTDGVLYLPRGLTQLEITALQKQFKTVGAPTGKPKKRRG